jgi:hypothetical protein
MSESGSPATAQSTVPPRLRIGVTGHRTVTGDHPGLLPEIAKAIEYITQMLAVDPGRLRTGYPGQPEQGDIILTAVSSLAEGADRIVACEILKRAGTELEVVFPLPREDYVQDFNSPESVEQFDKLSANAVQTDVMRAARSRQQAYEQAGRAVVDRSDAMIVVWDGQPARGRGGTAEIYTYAQRRQKPVLLIRVDDHSSVLDARQLPRSAEGTIPLPPDSMKRLDQYNHERLAGTGPDGSSPLLIEPGSRPGLECEAGQIEYFSRHFARADLLARRFQSRRLWAMRALYILAPAALLVVAAQVDFAPDHPHYAWYEFGILVFVTLVLAATRLRRWHERWISARYLAEQIRSLMFLGLTGIVTPERSVSATYRQTIGEAGWTERAASEIWFARPRDVPPTDISLLIEVLCEEWIKKQQEYHQKVNEAFRRRSNVIQAAAVVLFALSALFALLHSLDVGSSGHSPFKGWDFLAIAIPAIAGALGSYGAQRDYLRHAERSKLFASVLDDAVTRLMSVRDLADIQQTALSVSRAMRSEATDWYSVVRPQDPELPS